MSLVTKKTRIKIDLPKEEAQPVVVEETDTAAAKNTKSKPRKTAKIETADAGLSVAAPDVEDDQADTVVEPALKRKPVKFKSDPITLLLCLMICN